MNRTQQRYVVSWMGVVALLVVAILKAEWISEHWHALRWLLFVFIAVAAAVGPKIPSRSERSAAIADTVHDYPIIGVWLAFCGLVFAFGIYWVLSRHVDLEKELGPLTPLFLMLLIFVLIAPFIIVRAIGEYKSRGAQSNPTAESDAHKGCARGSS